MTNDTLAYCLENAKTLGLDASRGNDSLTMLAMSATSWVATGFASQDDAEAIYLAYAEGVNTSLFGGKIATDNPKTLKVQVSCFRTFMKPEVVANGEIHGRTLVERNKLKSTDATKSAYNSLVAINRGQIKKGVKALTDKEIKDILTPKEKVEKGVAELIASLYKKAIEIDDAHKPAGFQKVIAEFAAYVNGVATGSELIAAAGSDKPENEEVMPESNQMDTTLAAAMLSSIGRVTVQ